MEIVESSLLYSREDGTQAFVHDTYSSFFAAKEAVKRLENGSLDLIELYQLMGFGREGSGTVTSQFSSTFEFLNEMVGDRYKPPKLIKIVNDKRIQELGSIMDYHGFGYNLKLLVYIQDPHAHYEGQKKIAHILEYLIVAYGLKLILVEGGVTDKDFTYLRERAPLKERIEKADKLLKEGVISGEEYLNIASDYPMTFQGIEDKKLYDRHCEALWEIDKFKDIALEYVEKLIVASDAVKPKIHNADLLELDDKKRSYDNEAIHLLAYYEYLFRKAEELELPLHTFPNFIKLIKLGELERKIYLVKIHCGSASEEERRLYSQYVNLKDDLNISQLFEEEALLEKSVENALSQTQDQKNLLNISRALSIMKNLLRIKGVPEEYRYFQENEDHFNPDFWASFLQEKSRELGIDTNIPENSYIMKDNLAKVEEFYGIAAERNEMFFKKINTRMEKDNVNLAALIAGGFHKLYLTKLFLDNGYSYIVISPLVTTPMDDELYRKALKREWLPDIE